MLIKERTAVDSINRHKGVSAVIDLVGSKEAVSKSIDLRKFEAPIKKISITTPKGS